LATYLKTLKNYFIMIIFGQIQLHIVIYAANRKFTNDAYVNS